MKHLVYTLLIGSLFVGCKKDEPEPEPPKPVDGSTVKIQMHHVVGSQDLVFGQWYLNPAGDSFKVSKFNYYISNIVLVRENGDTYTQPESYFIMKHPSPVSIDVSGVPAGTYTQLRLLIGVDSLRNTSGAQSGGLDPAHGMFWSWNSGYIFMKLEGESPQSGATSKALTFHLGGFKGENKTQRYVQLDLGAPLEIGGNSPQITLKADINEIFKSPTTVDFATLYYQMSPGPDAKVLADNYADMFSVESVQK